MDITIKIKLDPGGAQPAMVAYANSPSSGESERFEETNNQVDPGPAAPSADLLARAQAIGASNAGAAPADRPAGDGPPVFTSIVPLTGMDEASDEKELWVGPTDISAGAAPGTTTDDDVAVGADAIPRSDDAAGGATDVGEPTKRTAKKTASSSVTKAAGRATSKK